MPELRDTYADLSGVYYRVEAAASLLGVTPLTLRRWDGETAEPAPRATDLGISKTAFRVYTPEKLFSLAAWRRERGRGQPPMTKERPAIITVHIVKGGTGKTTTAVETAVHLQMLGLRVLVIDLDVQANATQALGYNSAYTLDDAQNLGLSAKAIVTHTFADVIERWLRTQDPATEQQPSPPLDDLIKQPFGVHGPHLIPADLYLDRLERVLSRVATPAIAFDYLFTAASKGQTPSLPLDDYDVVILDCPPSTNTVTYAALYAADMVVAPTVMDSYAMKGLTRLSSVMQSTQATTGREYAVRILRTHYRPRLKRTAAVDAILAPYEKYLAPQTIPALEAFPAASDQYLPLMLFKPRSPGTLAYRAFAADIYAWITKRAKQKRTLQ